MNNVLDSIHSWLQNGEGAALATVISTWGSSPRQAGSKMAVSQAGAMVGSVSAGCVEGAVVQEALESLIDGRPRLLEYGVSDERALEVGLTCGGRLEVFVEPFGRGVREGGAPQLEQLIEGRAEGRVFVRTVAIRGPESLRGQSALFSEDGTCLGQGSRYAGPALVARVKSVAETGLPRREVIALPEGEVDVFFDPLTPAPTLVIVGGVHIAVTLTRLAKAVGFRVVIVDPRRSFATDERFPSADRIVRLWPDEALRQIGLRPTTAVAVLSHDPKLDDPALVEALRSRAAYVGAVGSAATNAARRERLASAGLTEPELDRLRAPIGLPWLGEAPEAIALGVLAEIVAIPAIGWAIGGDS